MTVENGATSDSPPTEVSATADTTAVAGPVQDASSAASSPAKDESLMDRVTAALKPKTEGSSPSPEVKDAKPGAESASEDEEPEPDSDPTEEEKARYHSKTRKQITRLLRQRNEALDEVKVLKPEAEGFRKITNFIADSGMTADEANLLLEVGRNMKRDPLKALEQLKPYYDALQRMAGDVLPADLQTAVTKGEVTEPYARQLARSRTEKAVLSSRTQAADDANRQRQQQESTKQHGDAVASAISVWEANQAKTDLDWKSKQERIGELIELEVRRNGFPPTTQAAIEMAERAKTKATAEIARFVPRKTNVTNINPASAARPVASKPKSVMEAVDQALAAG